MMKTKAEVWIPLTQGKVTVIDFDDFEKVRGHKWYAHKGWGDTWYARAKRKSDRAWIYLHRLLTDAPPGSLVDHKDGDGLNCRRYNIRLASNSQNQQNTKKRAGTSQFKGVSWITEAQKWMAQIKVENKKQHLGYFRSEEAAARAYDTAAVKHFGEFAAPNFPTQQPNQCSPQTGINV